MINYIYVLDIILLNVLLMRARNLLEEIFSNLNFHAVISKFKIHPGIFFLK